MLQSMGSKRVGHDWGTIQQEPPVGDADSRRLNGRGQGTYGNSPHLPLNFAVNLKQL